MEASYRGQLGNLLDVVTWLAGRKKKGIENKSDAMRLCVPPQHVLFQAGIAVNGAMDSAVRMRTNQNAQILP